MREGQEREKLGMGALFKGWDKHPVVIVHCILWAGAKHRIVKMQQCGPKIIIRV